MIAIQEYRGHIRNWRDLCNTLDIDAALPRQQREEAILIRAYETWKYDMAAHLHGMFAFALWDETDQTLFCLRDHFGTKPFYYYQTADGRLLYGTMIRQILNQPGFHKELNENALQLYLSLTYAAGEDTFFKGLKKLMPGCYLLWRDGKLQITRYWKPEFHPDESKTLDDWADEIHTTLQQIMGEIKETGETADAFLSGGVDSSYVLAMSDAAVSDSCGYAETCFDESVFARQTADALGRANQRCLITPEAYFAAMPTVMYHMEQPLGDASAAVFALACQAAAAHTKLCYSGEGADEFFGGYNIYLNAARYGDQLCTFYVGNTNIMKEDEKHRLLLRYDETVQPISLVKNIYQENEGLDPLTKMCDVDIQIWLEGDIYLNIDKMSQLSGLEIRMPLTDRRLFQIASRMPSCYKVDGSQNKIAFRKAAAKVLPPEIAYRKKQGFPVPIRLWMADERYNQSIQAKLFGSAAARFFHLEALRDLWTSYIKGDSALWRKIWTIYSFLVWYEMYF